MFNPKLTTRNKWTTYVTITCLLSMSSSLSYSQKKLWGMSAGNGSGYGTIFMTDSVGDNYTDVFTFSNPTDGIDPYGSLIQATDGKIYGMTRNGGANNFGTIFRIDPMTFVYTKVHDFDSTNGKHPH